MHVIAITGLIGSGKDSVAEYIIEKHGYQQIDFGNIAREFTKKTGREVTRKNIQKTRKELNVTHGKDIFSKEVINIIKKNNWQKIIITGFRHLEDLELIKEEFGNNLIFLSIKTDEKIRFERLKKRSSPRDPSTLKEFQEQERNEEEIFDIKELMMMVNFIIDNSGTKEELHNKIDVFMKDHSL